MHLDTLTLMMIAPEEYIQEWLDSKVELSFREYLATFHAEYYESL